MKKLLLISFLSVLLVSIRTFAQTNTLQEKDSIKDKLPDNWFNLDPIDNGIQGISTNKAYELLLKEKKSRPVIVAVIDSGVDIEHEDLQEVIWVNTDETSNNGIDDDHNGYVDDINGWNFLGNANGENITGDSYELTREYARLSKKFNSTKKIKKKDRESHKYYQQIKKEFERQKAEAEKQQTFLNNIKRSFDLVSNYFDRYFNHKAYSESDIRSIEADDQATLQAKKFMLMAYENGINEDVLNEEEERLNKTLNYAFNVEYDPRGLVGDNYEDIDEKGYGNNNVKGPDASHGTHVAGIIAANRINNIGIKGVAKNVKVMPIRAVPDGDERDKDIANAIYYAVDNGAKIINMSFGKSYSPNKEAIDEAVKYAAKKDVLLIHAAGNSSKNIDVKNNFPNKYFKDGKAFASNWIEVGASSAYLGEALAGSFSNYGKESVDVFAPGVAITSTIPNQNYDTYDGTSMAAPTVTGLAALLLSYFPELSYQEVKNIIISSAINHKSSEVNQPTNKSEKVIVPFGELSKSGAIINVYNAVKMATSIAEM